MNFNVPCQKQTLKLLSKSPPCVGKAHEAMRKGSFPFQVPGRQKPNTRSRLGRGEREERKPEGGREKGKTKERTKRLQEKLASTFSGTEDEKKDLKKS